MSFQVRALDKTPFEPLFAMDDAKLAACRALRTTADTSPGFPCRVSLQDAAVGETVILVNYEHQPAETPYRASHAVWVRAGAQTARPAPGDVPQQLRTRTLSLRAFDAQGMIAAADLVDGREVEGLIEVMFADPAIAYIHAHFAKPGYFAARTERV